MVAPAEAFGVSVVDAELTSDLVTDGLEPVGEVVVVEFARAEAREVDGHGGQPVSAGSELLTPDGSDDFVVLLESLVSGEVVSGAFTAADVGFGVDKDWGLEGDAGEISRTSSERNRKRGFWVWIFGLKRRIGCKLPVRTRSWILWRDTPSIFAASHVETTPNLCIRRAWTMTCASELA
jgi:hypothetical protein